MAKPELGEKHLCLSCGTKYYDLNRDPIACPKCGEVFAVEEIVKPEPEAAKPAEAPAKKPEKKVEETEADAPEIISLEDADEDEGDTVDGDDVPDDIPDVEVEDDDDDNKAAGPFLETDDEDDDMSDIIPVPGDKKEDQ